MAKKIKKPINTVICVSVGSKFKFIKCHLTINNFMDKPSLEVRREKKLGMDDKFYKFINSNDNKLHLVICDVSKNKLLSYSGGCLQSTHYGNDECVTNTIRFTSSEYLSIDFSKYILNKSFKWYSESLRKENHHPDPSMYI